MKSITNIILLILLSSSLFNCADQSGSSGNATKSINGTYTVNTGQFSGSITVYGDNWSGSVKLCDYCETTYDSGTIQNGRLYDSSGYVDIGYVSGNSITTTFGGQRITLTK